MNRQSRLLPHPLSIEARSQYLPTRLPDDPQSGRFLGFRENFERRDVVFHRQISRTDNREKSLPRTRLALFGSSCGNAIEARSTRCETDAGARSRPGALASAAPLDRTKMAHRAAQGKRMTASHSQLRNWVIPSSEKSSK